MVKRNQDKQKVMERMIEDMFEVEQED